MRKRLIAGVIAVAGLALVVGTPVFADNCETYSSGKCTGILPESWCEGAGGGAIEILGLILNILTAGVGVLLTVGLVVSAIRWMTARDNEEQTKQSRRRIINIVIGAATWALLWAALNWLIPGFSTDINLPDYTEPESCDDGLTPGNSGGSGGDGDDGLAPAVESSFPIGDPTETSEFIPCDPRTVDLGVWPAWNSGVFTRHRLCSVTNLPQRAEGYGGVLKGPTESSIEVTVAAGRSDLQSTVVVNSRVSGAWYSMVEAAKKDGVEILARNSFRTMKRQFGKGYTCYTEKQQAMFLGLEQTLKPGQPDPPLERIPASSKCPGKAPAGHSPHQNAMAVDMSKWNGTKVRCNYKIWKYCSNKSDPLYKWLRANSTRFGITQTNDEFWHYDSKCPGRKWGSRKPTFCGGKYNGGDV